MSIVDNRAKGRSCPKCSLEGRSGENAYNYNPDLTDGDREKRRDNKRIPFWRKEVYVRDNYTCQVCGDNQGGNLNAHHLMGYNKYLKLRFDKNNGTTLCKKCHIDFHSIYGKGNNTKEQFEEYKKGLVIKDLLLITN